MSFRVPSSTAHSSPLPLSGRDGFRFGMVPGESPERLLVVGHETNEPEPTQSDEAHTYRFPDGEVVFYVAHLDSVHRYSVVFPVLVGRIAEMLASEKGIRFWSIDRATRKEIRRWLLSHPQYMNFDPAPSMRGQS